MSMTNAQAALIAASKSPYGGSANVISFAAEYLEWLDSKDNNNEQPVIPTMTGGVDWEHVPSHTRRPQCTDVNSSGARCDLPADHAGKHENDHDSSTWGWITNNGHRKEAPVVIDKPSTPPVAPRRHFLPSTAAEHTTCGLAINRDQKVLLKVTNLVGDVTCAVCKEELGL